MAQHQSGAVLHWPSTLLARRNQPLAGEHLRWQLPHGQPAALHVFALDCSASMVESGAFAAAKGLLLQCMRWAYLQRMPVALLCFGAGQLHWHWHPRRAPQWNADVIEPLHGGGGTPLAAAFDAAWALLAQHHSTRNHLWVLSDFRSADVWQLMQTPPSSSADLVHVLVDCEAAASTRQRSFGGAAQLAAAWANTVRMPLP